MSPAKAITPSITKTLKRDKTNKSERSKLDKETDTKKRIKKVIISKSSKVIRSHSEKQRNAADRTTQIESNLIKKIVEVLEGQNTAK
jgi:predicted glycosyl hydrolase (DUF1957 family)